VKAGTVQSALALRLAALVSNKEALEKHFEALNFFPPLFLSREKMEGPSGPRRERKRKNKSR